MLEEALRLDCRAYDCVRRALHDLKPVRPKEVLYSVVQRIEKDL